eukprot:COSAG01_NODE_8055_length_2937_cov_4.352361_1_plen_596_part_01
MPRGASLSAQELVWIKEAIGRIEAIKAQRSTSYPRAVWQYVCDFTGRSEKTVKGIICGRYDPPDPTSPQGDEPEEPPPKRRRTQGGGSQRPEDLAPELPDLCRTFCREANNRTTCGGSSPPVYAHQVLKHLHDEHAAVMAKVPSLALREAITDYDPLTEARPEGSDPNYVPLRSLQRCLGRCGFAFGPPELARPVKGEKPEFLRHKRRYVRRQVQNRRGGKPCVRAINKRRLIGLTKKDRAPVRQTGRGFHRKWVTLDEAAVCANHVGRLTLHYKGDPVNRAEGAGRRLCMGLAAIYWSEPPKPGCGEGKVRAKTLHYFQFRAQGGKKQSAGAKTKGGPSAQKLLAGIKQLLGGKRVATVSQKFKKLPTKKDEVVELYKELTAAAMANDTAMALLQEVTAAEEEGALKVDAHKAGDKVEDSFDYHGNFTAERYELWLDKVCRLLYEEITGVPWVDGESEPLDPTGEHRDVKMRGGVVRQDGASYHMRVVNPSPTIGWNRPEMIEWLKTNHPDKITAADEADWKQAGKGGLNRKELFAIIQPLKLPKRIAAYDIVAKYGHHVRAGATLAPSVHPYYPSLHSSVCSSRNGVGGVCDSW